MIKKDDEFSVTFKKKHAIAGIIIALLLIGEEGRKLVTKLIAGLLP